MNKGQVDEDFDRVKESADFQLNALPLSRLADRQELRLLADLLLHRPVRDARKPQIYSSPTNYILGKKQLKRCEMSVLSKIFDSQNRKTVFIKDFQDISANSDLFSIDEVVSCSQEMDPDPGTLREGMLIVWVSEDDTKGMTFCEKSANDQGMPFTDIMFYEYLNGKVRYEELGMAADWIQIKRIMIDKFGQHTMLKGLPQNVHIVDYLKERNRVIDSHVFPRRLRLRDSSETESIVANLLGQIERYGDGYIDGVSFMIDGRRVQNGSMEAGELNNGDAYFELRARGRQLERVSYRGERDFLRKIARYNPVREY